MPTEKANEDGTDSSTHFTPLSQSPGFPLFVVLQEMARQKGGSIYPHTTKIIGDAEFVAGMLGTNEGTVNRWVKVYRIPGWNLGRTRYYDFDDFLNHMPRTTNGEETGKRGGDDLPNEERRKVAGRGHARKGKRRDADS